ncbi:PEST proteolytic signal-containing nuclear protein-like [Daktulosphaira vitifoliae]|uniref:PEST proteolytic signal-containing nuclear protein-like n=1 Tax=Daktulosphaira vitifoliae TaxID=58002 RepID=UPI0021A984BE|nr:PEST proteolytic signal-containing nuclear protein-like [Daktulosphaira vitifoliae]
MSKRSSTEFEESMKDDISKEKLQDKKQKLTFGMKKSIPTKTGIKIKLNTPSSKEPPLLPKPASKSVAAVFGDVSDEEPEEMPREARMRMRNIGRDTPTSAGPNSFGKTKHGFCNTGKLLEKTLKEATKALVDDNK